MIKPLVSSVEFTILASASAGCTDEVATLVLHEELIHDGVTEDGNSDTTHGSPAAATGVSAKCAPGTWTNTADVAITPLDGYVLTGGNRFRSATSAPLHVGTFDCDLVS